jgi:hypothetical protein
MCGFCNSLGWRKCNYYECVDLDARTQLHFSCLLLGHVLLGKL